MINQDPIEDRATKLAKRHGIERLAVETGQKREKAHQDLLANTEYIVRLMPEAVAADIPIDTFAKLVGVSRQTLYRWKDEYPKTESKRLPLFTKDAD